MADKLVMAEQQILGYHAAKYGETWQMLISGMGLTFDEYLKMEEKGMLDYLSEQEKSYILEACSE